MPFQTLNKKVQTLIEERGWSVPTPAQEKAVPEILAGSDVLLIAPTGIGKTESAVLPIFSKLVEKEHKPISVLYITPLRALNRDMFSRIFWWADRLDLEVGVRHGDTTQYQRSKQVASPPDMLITTPETLQSILPGSRMRQHLANVRYVVIDEVHELVASKRGTQLSVGLERLRKIAGGFQIIGLSATVGSPEKVAKFLTGGRPVKVIRAVTPKDLELRVLSPNVTAQDRVLGEKVFLSAEAAARLRAIHDLIAKHKSSLVFTNTREAAEVLSSRLSRMEKKWSHDIHHSSLSKEVRIAAEEQFKSEALKALICTSSLELGIDIGSIDLVIQHMSPRQVSKLVQRAGRSGHRIGGKSLGIIIAGDADDVIESAVIARKAMAGELEETKIYDKPLDVLASQVAGLTLEEYDRKADDIFALVTKAYPYHNMKREDFDSVLLFLKTLRMLYGSTNPKEQGLRRTKKAWQYYYDNLSTIPDVFQYRVTNNIDGTDVGVLDEAFVAEYGSPGTTFIVRGSSWRILSVHEGKVLVEPAQAIESAIPAWEGELIPVPFSIAQEVGALRRRIAADLYGVDLSDYKLSEEAAKKIIDYVAEQVAAKKPVPDDKTLLIEDDKDFVVIHSCFGSLVNQTLSRYLGVMLSAQLGRSVAIKSDPYRIIIQGVQKEAVAKLLKEDPEEMASVVKRTIDYTQMFRWRLIHVAKRFGAVTRRAKWDKINLTKMVEYFQNTPVFEEAKNEVFHEKMDLPHAKQIMAAIRDGKVVMVLSDGLSPIAKRGVEHQFRELIGPKRPEREIFEAFKDRLLNTYVRLVCVKCAGWATTKAVKAVKDDPDCPKCGSGLIAVFKPSERNEKLIKRLVEKKPLADEEKEMVERLQHSADLVLTYGARVIPALAGRGIGPETAIRILAKQKEGEEYLKDILEAERQFAKTKRYWA